MIDDRLVYFATDLVGFSACRHLSHFEHAAAHATPCKRGFEFVGA